MTWSVTATGKVEAVKTKVAADFGRVSLQKPEQDVVSRIAEAITGALTDLPDGTVVKIAASGSGYRPDNDQRGFVQSFTVTFEPVYGFLE